MILHLHSYNNNCVLLYEDAISCQLGGMMLHYERCPSPPMALSGQAMHVDIKILIATKIKVLLVLIMLHALYILNIAV